MPSCILMCLNNFHHGQVLNPLNIRMEFSQHRLNKQSRNINSADALRLALADACKRYVVDPGLLYGIADSAIRTINRDIWWISRHAVGVQEYVRLLFEKSLLALPTGCFQMRAVNRTQQNYQACMFGQALCSSTSQLRDARDWYKKS